MSEHIKWVVFVLLAISCCTCKSSYSGLPYKSEQLEIQQLTAHTYLHISYLDIPFYGKFACNGLIYANEGEALIFDTPPDDEVSEELIKWVRLQLKAEIKGIVINHFHDDCLGGLHAFHEANIPSYANQLTLELAKKDSVIVPQYGFDKKQILTVGGASVINQYIGAGHAPDNIVSYIPQDEVLFGGCMIKPLGGRKGNLVDADTLSWPKTVAAVKAQFPAKVVIPGHGKVGGIELLDYTIQLFSSGK